MMQFSRPKKSLAAALDPFKRREAPASEYLNQRAEPAGTVPPPSANRFDPAYYRTHDPVSFVAPDAQTVVSQAITNNMPILPGTSFAKGRPAYSGYAGSIASQMPADTSSLAGSTIGYSQFDRLNGHAGDMPRPRRRLSGGSLAPSDAPTASMYKYDYKAGDDMSDTQSIATSQAGVTDF